MLCMRAEIGARRDGTVATKYHNSGALVAS